ncbi:hypothetical protein BC829DRAFT_362268, partial [Chytridium lagenaria]
DVLIITESDQVVPLRSGSKNFIFLSYLIPQRVQRLWIMEMKPKAALHIVVQTGTVHLPGEITDNVGLGNADFNKGLTEFQYAYPVHGVYELNKPLQPIDFNISLDFVNESHWRHIPMTIFEKHPLNG